MLAAALFLATETPIAPACVPLKGGPVDGMCVGPTISSDGDEDIVSLLAGPGPGSRMSPEVSAVTARFLESLRTQAPFDPSLFAAEGVATFCPKLSQPCSQSWPLQSWPLSPNLVPSAPFKIYDGRIRIEWRNNGRIEYLSVLKFEGGKIANIWILPAAIALQRRR